MSNKSLRLFIVSCLVLSVLFGFLGQLSVGQENGSRVVNVDTGLSYSGIQAAIDASETLDGHTIQVGAGVFMEHVTVNKSVSLVSESPDATVIDGGGVGIVVYVTSNEVEVRNFSIRNGDFGLWLNHSSNSKIIDNQLSNGSYGIRLYHSPNSLVVGNNVNGYSHFGIELDSSGNSILDSNEASFASYDLYVVRTNNSVITRNTALIRPDGYSVALDYSHNNLIYRNTFVNSLLFVEAGNEARFTPRNDWDNGLEGNFWLSYEGSDFDQDGIGDAAYEVGESNVDNFPLMGRFSEFDVAFDGKAYNFALISNATVTEFQFNADERRLSFNAVGGSETAGFCRFAVPVAFLQELGGGGLRFQVNGKEPFFERQWSDEAFAYWYVSFVSASSQAAFDPFFTGAFVLVFLILVGVVLVFLWKWRVRVK